MVLTVDRGEGLGSFQKKGVRLLHAGTLFSTIIL